jgi:uncharacterized protein (TIGR02246 family)
MDDERQIVALHERILDGWNRGSGADFAAPFSADAVFIGFDGTIFRGRQAIADSHQELFDRWLKGTRLTSDRIDVRFPNPDVAVVHAAGGTIMRGKDRPAPEWDSVQTLVSVRDGDAWTFVCFQNTRVRPMGANAASALLWLLPDKLWRLVRRRARKAERA